MKERLFKYCQRSIQYSIGISDYFAIVIGDPTIILDCYFFVIVELPHFYVQCLVDYLVLVLDFCSVHPVGVNSWHEDYESNRLNDGHVLKIKSNCRWVWGEMQLSLRLGPELQPSSHNN